MQPEDLPDAWLIARPAPVVHVAAMPLDAAERIVETLRRKAPDAVILLDTHEDYVRGYRDRLLHLAASVDVFLPSREELLDLVGYDDPARAVQELWAQKGAPLVVAKMGKGGVLLWDRDRSKVVPVEATEEGTDRWAIEQGYVSLMPLSLDLTDHPALSRVQQLDAWKQLKFA